ncbi:histidine kinase [Streptomyces sp. NPDC000151]|uniref:histidine kinase n=1 Tax=Streptomyces sp. NPDC000151 TaxID=3154244 RepID=UPI0033246BB6
MTARAVAWTAALLSAAAVGFALWVSTLPGAGAVGPATSTRYVAVVGTAALLWAVTGAVLATLRPHNVVGWIVLGSNAALVLGPAAYGGYGAIVADPPWPGASASAFLTCGLFVPGWLIPQSVLLAVYPDGRLPARWWRWPVAGALMGTALLTVTAAFDPSTYRYFFPGLEPPVRLPGPTITVLLMAVCLPLVAVSMVTIWAATLLRLMRAQPPHRQRLALLVSAAAPTSLASTITVGRLSEEAALVLAALSCFLPVAVAIGMLRYRMSAVEILLRRGLVYGLLTAAIILVYMAISALVGAAFDRRPLPGVVCATLVTMLFAPARDRLQRAVERFVYGAHRDPLRAMTHLGRRVAAAEETDLLPAALVAIMQSVRSSGVAVLAPDGRLLSAVGSPATGQALPLRVGGRDVGTLRLDPPYARRYYTRSARQLLQALSSQIAVLVLALSLTEALKHERDRVYVAVRSERVRLRHDLHDGLGPSLSGVGLGLQAVTDLLNSKDDSRCQVLLLRIRAEVDAAVQEIRRIIDGLRPAVLDAVGLVAAIHRQAGTIEPALPVKVLAEELPDLPRDVEAAAYHIVTEALTNCVRHAHAHSAVVTLAVSADPEAGDRASLHITVADDGTGVGDALPGVGLTSMRRRAAALGGTFAVDAGWPGTVVTAVLPLEAT